MEVVFHAVKVVVHAAVVEVVECKHGVLVLEEPDESLVEVDFDAHEVTAVVDVHEY